MKIQIDKGFNHFRSNNNLVSVLNQELGGLYNLFILKGDINTELFESFTSESQEQAQIDALELMIQHYDYLATKFTRLRDESMELKESLLKGV